MKDTMTLKNVRALDVYKEVIGFMAVNGYHLDQSVEPVKIVGTKKIERSGKSFAEAAGSIFGGLAKLDVGFWQRGKDLTVVLDFSGKASSDADTIKGIILHRFGQE